MRVWKFLTLSLVMFLPVLTQGEVLRLKDGSSIQGKLLRLVNDTLYFETSFGSEIRVTRDKVLRIDFVEPGSTLVYPPTQPTPQQSSLPGTVMVSFEKFKVTSRVTVHRGKDEEAIIRANSIECAFYIGPSKMFSAVDSVTDKEIREGPDTVYKNDMRPERVKVAITSGSYQCRLFLRNWLLADYKDSFIGDPLEKELLVENVKVLPGQTTQLRIGMKRKRKIGSRQLFVYE